LTWRAQQHVLARLRHRAVDGADHEDAAVHLRGAGDHVLDVVGVARAVDVRVMPVRRRILDVARAMVMTFDSSRRPCDSEALATSSYEMNFAQPLSPRPW
jgi:hypothetical protein